MLSQRRGFLRTAAGVMIGTALTLLVMTTRRPTETTPTITSALVQSSDDLALSLPEVTAQLAHALSPANQRPSCRSTIYPGGKCRCDDVPGGDTCALTPGMDGKTPVCLGPAHLVPGRPCLIYSVGIRADLSFESEMVKFGCTVHVFDPLRVVNASGLPQGMHVHAIGVGGTSQALSVARQSLQMLTLDDLVHHMGHQGRQIDYLKMSTAGEWRFLRQQLDSGAALRNIAQLAVTLHLRYPEGIFDQAVGIREQLGRKDASDFLQRVQGLQEAGFQLTRSQPGEEKFDGTTLSHEYRTFWTRQ